MVGQTISHYRIISKLGEGGMGVVYQAEDTNLRRTVALKFVTSDDPARFLHEAQAAAALHHPNICTIFEIDREHGLLAMEYLEGQTLRDKIRERPLRLDEAIDIVEQIGAGLQAAHEKGVVHRDIKSGNVAITRKGQVKIMDFGLAQLAGGTRITRTGAAIGTPAYMAPEQARGEAVDRRADLWSLGVVLYEMVTGRLPFPGDSEAVVIHSILHSEPEPPTALRSGLPVQLDRAIAKALRKDPKDRYQHVDDFLVDLRAASKSAAAVAGLPQRSPMRWVYFAAGLLLGGGIAGLIALSRIASPVARGDTAATQITSYSGTERWGVISPDGKHFAFVSDKGGRPDIWVRQISGGEPVQITQDAAAEARLAYSPDGESLYFDAQNAIWRIPSLGGRVTKITDGRIAPAPSPDGKRLACLRSQVVAESGQSTIEVCISDGTGCREVHSSPGVAQVSWSPDGKWIAFAAGTLFDSRDLHVIDPDGKNKRRVASFSGGSVYSQAWLPDSDALVVSGATDFPGPMSDTMDLSVVPLNGGHSRRLTLNVNVRFLNPSVASRGDRLLATSQAYLREVWKVPLGPDAKENGRAAVRMVESSLNPFWIQVVSRQSMLLFNSPATGLRNLWTMPLAPGVAPRQITAFTGSPARHGALSPDMTRIALSAREAPTGPSGTKISVMNLDGSNRVALTSGPSQDFWPCWSPDGKLIAFTSDRDGSAQIWTVNASGGAASRLNDAGGYRADWSPDGTRIAYWARGPSRIEIADARNGKPLIKIPFRSSFPVWSPDGQRLAAAEGDPTEGGNAVWVFDVATGHGRKVAEFPPNFHVVFRAGWTADGKALIVNRMDALSNIVLLERF